MVSLHLVTLLSSFCSAQFCLSLPLCHHHCTATVAATTVSGKWMDRSVDTLPPRPSLPALLVSCPPPHPSPPPPGPGVLPACSSEQLQAMIGEHTHTHTFLLLSSLSSSYSPPIFIIYLPNLSICPALWHPHNVCTSEYLHTYLHVCMSACNVM